ncbi:tryptophan synthase [Morchella snyderi]|nr:tryptophan synthase [Morchella snyderi]
MTTKAPYLTSHPDANGFFGPYGGSFIPPPLQAQMDEIKTRYLKLRQDPKFIAELDEIRRNYQGRPTPLQYAKRLSESVGGGGDTGVEIYLKREDLNHTGAHKLNHCMAEVLLAKHLNKRKVIAETGAGQHGVALATAAAYFGLECEIHMGAVDMAKEHPNVTRMRILGAKVVPVTAGLQTLKEAVDSAFAEYMADPVTAMYCIGSVVGPHPFPMMVRNFQQVVGEEAKEQFLERTGTLPDHVVACCGGGSNAMGIFSVFIDSPAVKLHAVEPLGRGPTLGDHAASLVSGSEGIMHGFNSIMLQTPPTASSEGPIPAPVHSIASGLDYPSVGPEQAYLRSIGRTEAGCGATDEETVQAFFALSRTEGIIPALESAHAVAWAMKLARGAVERGEKARLLVNLSGRGDKDVEYVVGQYPQLVTIV